MTKARFFIFLLTLLLAFAAPRSLHQEQKPLLQRPDVSAIEKDLLERINQERETRNLSLLKLSVELSDHARKHSQDMASQSKLSHISSSGKTYTERLLEGEFYFVDVGENIAFSETFLAEFIHQTLMESPEHRENILTPEFDLAGIGVIYKEDEGYYVTQEFIESLERKDDEEVKELIQEKIDEARRPNLLPSLLYEEEANHFARIFSQQKADNIPPPLIPQIFGETHIISITTPSLDEAGSSLKEILNPLYERGGLGVWFDRNKDYPGGTYFITLLLFPENKYRSMEEEALRQIILQAANEMRRRKGLGALMMDKNLSDEAKQISLLTMIQRRSEFTMPPRAIPASVITYVTERPDTLPRSIQEKLENPLIRVIGIGPLFGKTPKFTKGAFWLTILFEEESR